MNLKKWWDYNHPDWYLKYKLYLLRKRFKNKSKLLWQVYAAIIFASLLIIAYIRLVPFFVWLWHSYLAVNPEMCCMSSSPVPELMLTIEISFVFMLLITVYIDFFVARGHIGHMRRERRKTYEKRKESS